MVIQSFDKFGRLNIIGVGRICCKNDALPVIFSEVNKTAKASFSVTTGVVKQKDTDKYIYQNIHCAVYGRQYNKELFALLETVKQRDKVKFYGIFYPKSGIDAKTGAEVDYSEVNVEYLEICSTAIPKKDIRKLKSEQDVENAVKGATNKSKREKDYF